MLTSCKPKWLQSFKRNLLILVVVTFGAGVITYGFGAMRKVYSPLPYLVNNEPVQLRETTPKELDIEPDEEYLLDILKEKMIHLRTSGYLQTIPNTAVCGKHEKPLTRCKDITCKRPPTKPLSAVNIENIRKPVRMVGGTKKLLEETKKFNVDSKKKTRYVFLTGASSNHFKETESSIQSLYSNVFPHLNNYSLVYYDLGLKAKERAIVKNFTGIELKDFPFEKLPPTFRTLHCYTWKPLIVLSHLNSAEFVIWLDSSMNFAGDIRPYFNNVSYTGVLISGNNQAHAQHTSTSMFSYFAEEACNFAEYGELEGSFQVLHNEPFTRYLVIEPWSACALDKNCMCHNETRSMLFCNVSIRQYSKCHRFDQSAIGLILNKLLRENVESVILKNLNHSVKRGQKGTFLTDSV